MKQQSKITFLKRLCEQNTPLKARIELTRRCNLQCIHCKVHIQNAPQNELTLPEIDDLLRQLQAAGTIEISLTGGDIFARPDILGVLKTILTKDLRVHIQTNAAAVTPEIIELLALHKTKILRVAVSLFAADPAIHDAITQSPGSHARTIENIFNLRNAGVPVHCFTLILKSNAAYIEPLRRFYIENNIPHQFNTIIIPDEYACSGPLENRLPDEQLQNLPIDWPAYMNPENAQNPAPIPPGSTLSAICPAARFPVVTAEGDILPCSLIRNSAGNIREKTFLEIWNNSPVLKHYRAILVSDLECHACRHFPACKPCVGLSHLEHGDILKRPQEICRLTKHLMNKSPDQ